ncbi:DUF1653 domain-containing protein [Methylibium sp.]|uniref:DUF1653 domain-containing protein n=1 Tax=Methylibium sp. TaxID=2067992 RepID=UPI003D13E96C
MPLNDPLPALPEIVRGTYVHYKGARYEVLGVVRHSETLEPLVLYRPLYGERGLWVRPFSMFTETLTVDGALRPRFAFEHGGTAID